MSKINTYLPEERMGMRGSFDIGTLSGLTEPQQLINEITDRIGMEIEMLMAEDPSAHLRPGERIVWSIVRLPSAVKVSGKRYSKSERTP